MSLNFTISVQLSCVICSNYTLYSAFICYSHYFIVFELYHFKSSINHLPTTKHYKKDKYDNIADIVATPRRCAKFGVNMFMSLYECMFVGKVVIRFFLVFSTFCEN